MPSILGICPFGGTPYGVWQAKVCGCGPDKDTPDIQRGRFLEPIIRSMYAEHTGYEVQTPGMQRHPIETWAIASLDGLVIPPKEENGLAVPPGILEIKAPRYSKFVSLEEDGITQNYQVQMQHYMAVTGLQWADFCAWNADAFRLLIIRIQRDDDLISLMWDIARDFWQRYVLTGIAPEQATESKISLPPLEPTLVRIDTPEWNEAAREWREARGILKDAEAYEVQCKEKLIALALSTGKSKVKGADVSLSVDKNGIPRVRDTAKEQAA